jgi:KDO2-lipid IV(A) lauroyltransferase
MTNLMFALMWLVHFLPLRVISPLGSLGGAAFSLSAGPRRVARINLERCFPQMPAGERERLVRAHFRAFGRSFIAYGLWWWASRSRIERLVQVEGLEHLRALAGKPVIILAAHFLGLDAAATRLSAETNGVGIHAKQKNKVWGALLARGRGRFGDQLQISYKESIRTVLRAVRSGRPLYYLPDQDFGARLSIFVPFFGVPAATVPALTRIARLTGARVLPCSVRMLPGGRGYRVRIEPPWTDFPTDDLAADTRRLNAYVESQVLEMPEQYVWMHKRFRTRPPGEAAVY